MSTGPSSGSMLQNVLIFAHGMGYMAAASSLATVDPYQKFSAWGRRATWSSSRYRAGFFVKNKYLCWGAFWQASSTSRIHAVGTQRPNRSAMLHTNTVRPSFFRSGWSSR